MAGATSAGNRRQLVWTLRVVFGFLIAFSAGMIALYTGATAGTIGIVTVLGAIVGVLVVIVAVPGDSNRDSRRYRSRR